jgi:hypothetical protein
MLQIDHRQCFSRCETKPFLLAQYLYRQTDHRSSGATPHPTQFGLIFTTIPPMLQLGDKGRGKAKKILAGAGLPITI